MTDSFIPSRTYLRMNYRMFANLHGRGKHRKARALRAKSRILKRKAKR